MFLLVEMVEMVPINRQEIIVEVAVAVVVVSQVLYVIWKDPWMGVSRDTFIGSVLDRFWWGGLLPVFPVKYPELELTKYDPARTLLLFSSEPYPFLKRRAELDGLGFPYAFVDGESLSWFGVRTLAFLEREFARGE